MGLPDADLPRSTVRADPRWDLRAAIGRSLDEVVTPALVLDRSILERNVATMAGRMSVLSASLRPHAKAHKCGELARMQIAAGAVGVTTATVAEADAMVEAGVDDVLVANEVVAPASIARLASLAGRARVTAAVDDATNVEDLGRAATAEGVVVGVLVELDVGMGRGGARSADEALALARLANGTRGLELRGLMGYEGHCADEPDADLRSDRAAVAMERLVSTAGRCREVGLPVEMVSAGATGTHDVTGAFPGVTEVQAGSYALMDRFHEPLVSGFGFAVTVAATVIACHDDLVVLDAGRKSIGGDLRAPTAPDPLGVVAFLHEEHLGLRYPGNPPYRVGDRVRLVPGYAPTTVNLFGAYHVVEGDRVVDLWPVLARHGTP